MYNFAEHIIMNVFIYSQVLFISSVESVFNIFFEYPDSLGVIIILVVYIFFYVYTMEEIFKKNKLVTFAKSISIYLLSLVTYLLALLLLLLLYVLILHPELANQGIRISA